MSPSPPFSSDQPSGDLGADDREQQWVRDALRSLHSDDKVPAEVARRLDAQLADLQRERRVEQPDPAAGRPAPPHPRRRVGPAILAAAAVVVVIAVGVPVARQLSGGPASQGSASSARADSSASAQPSGAAAPHSSGLASERSSLDGREMAGAPLIHLQTASFQTGATTLVDLLVHPETSAEVATPGPTCAYRVPDAGVLQRSVFLDEQPALLAVLPAADGVRTVKALSCTDGSTLASTTVPAS